GAVDGDVDDLAGGAVRSEERRVGEDHSAGGQRLDVGGGVVEGVVPRPGQRVEGEAAIGAGQRGRKRRLEVVLAGVDVGNRQRAAHGLERGGGVGHPSGGGGRGAADRGAVIGAVDGDVDDLAGGAV